MDAPFLFLARKLGLHSMARLEDLLYSKAMSLRLEWFEYPRYYDGLQRVMEPRGPMNEMEQNWQLLQAQNVLVTVFQAVGILFALSAVHWSVPVAMLTVSAVLLLSHGVQVEAIRGRGPVADDGTQETGVLAQAVDRAQSGARGATVRPGRSHHRIVA